jgi:hypothetical protein
LMAVAVRDAMRVGRFEGVVSQTLFRAAFDRLSIDFGSVYSPAPDGQQFVVNESVHDGDVLLVATLNWTPTGR